MSSDDDDAMSVEHPTYKTDSPPPRQYSSAEASPSAEGGRAPVLPALRTLIRKRSGGSSTSEEEVEMDLMSDPDSPRRLAAVILHLPSYFRQALLRSLSATDDHAFLTASLSLLALHALQGRDEHPPLVSGLLVPSPLDDYFRSRWRLTPLSLALALARLFKARPALFRAMMQPKDANRAAARAATRAEGHGALPTTVVADAVPGGAFSVSLGHAAAAWRAGPLGGASGGPRASHGFLSLLCAIILAAGERVARQRVIKTDHPDSSGMRRAQLHVIVDAARTLLAWQPAPLAIYNANGMAAADLQTAFEQSLAYLRSIPPSTSAVPLPDAASSLSAVQPHGTEGVSRDSHDECDVLLTLLRTAPASVHHHHAPMHVDTETTVV
jgi:hypothetical protein